MIIINFFLTTPELQHLLRHLENLFFCITDKKKVTLSKRYIHTKLTKSVGSSEVFTDTSHTLSSNFAHVC